MGTDAILLGSWVTPPDHGCMLDIGTGCGIITLMLAQSNPNDKDMMIKVIVNLLITS